MVNETINMSGGVLSNITAKGISAFSMNINQFVVILYDRLMDIITAPARIPGMLWIITPLVAALLLMEFYFGRYTKEELGWNTAVGNSLVLIFVSIDLLRYIYGDTNFLAMEVSQIFVVEKTIIALAVAAGSILLLFTEFFHMLPKKFAFFVSSSLPVNLTAFFAIILVYSDIPLDVYTLISALVMFIALLIVFRILKMLVPKAQRQDFIEPKKRYNYDSNGLKEKEINED